MSTDGGASDRVRLEEAQVSFAVTIEPDLRLLKGLTTVLRYLSERSPSDLIDPAALAALIVPAEDAVDRLIALHHVGSQ